MPLQTHYILDNTHLYGEAENDANGLPCMKFLISNKCKFLKLQQKCLAFAASFVKGH